MTDLVTETINSWRNSPFIWGVEDCVLSIMDYVYKLTGEDPAAKFRGTYSSERAANQIVQKYGSIQNLIDKESHLQHTTVPVRGRIMLVEVLGVVALGLCTGDSVVLRSVDKGVVEVNLAYVKIISIWIPGENL